MTGSSSRDQRLAEWSSNLALMIALLKHDVPTPSNSYAASFEETVEKDVIPMMSWILYQTNIDVYESRITDSECRYLNKREELRKECKLISFRGSLLKL